MRKSEEVQNYWDHECDFEWYKTNRRKGYNTALRHFVVRTRHETTKTARKLHNTQDRQARVQSGLKRQEAATGRLVRNIFCCERTEAPPSKDSSRMTDVGAVLEILVGDVTSPSKRDETRFYQFNCRCPLITSTSASANKSQAYTHCIIPILSSDAARFVQPHTSHSEAPNTSRWKHHVACASAHIAAIPRTLHKRPVLRPSICRLASEFRLH